MPLFEYPELAVTQLVLLLLSVRWLLKRNDEIPLLISSFLFYVTSYRYWIVTSGIGRWVVLTQYGLSPVTEEDALKALASVVFGQICLLGTYMLYQKQVLPIVNPNEGERSFFDWLRPKVLFFGLFCLPLVILSRANILAQIRGGRSLAFDVNNYLYLFPMVLIGIAALTICLWKFGGLPNRGHKIIAIAILMGVANLTFSPVSRFQFLGWIASSAVILSSSLQSKKRLMALSIFCVIALSIFAIAGAMRGVSVGSEALNEAAWSRATNAEDANMLDGFVILQRVYPQLLDFRWGMEHLEILMRPIPRAWWPEKPIGGSYLVELGLVNPTKGTTLGISPTLLGSFYAEAGFIGITLCSFIYARILAKIVSYSTQIQPFAGVLVRAILIASLIPLLRGGDLAGIYAWIGMAFWPCFLLLWMKRKDFREKTNHTNLQNYHFYHSSSTKMP